MFMFICCRLIMSSKKVNHHKSNKIVKSNKENSVIPPTTSNPQKPNHYTGKDTLESSDYEREVTCEETTIVPLDAKENEKIVANSGQELSKSAKKKLKKQRQKAKSQAESKQKVTELIQEIERLNYLSMFQQAEPLIEAAFRCNPTGPELLRLYMAKMENSHRQRKIETNIKDCKKILELEPENDIIISFLVQGHLALGDVKEVKDFIQHSGDKIPNGARHVKTEVVKLEELLTEVEEKEKEENYAEASDLLTKCVVISGYSAKLYLWKARMAILANRHDEAMSAFLELSTLHQKNKNCEVKFVEGLLSYYRCQFGDALDAFSEAKIGGRKEAKAWIKKLEKIQEVLEEYRDERDEYRWNNALQILNKAFDLDKNNRRFQASLHVKKANLLSELARKEDALFDLTTAIELNPIKSDLYYYFLRGCLLYDMKKYQEAFPDLVKAFDNTETNVNEFAMLTDVAEKLKKIANALDNNYKILGVEVTATDGEIEEGYKRKIEELELETVLDAQDAARSLDLRKFSVNQAYRLVDK